jgi:hypothetical protein
MIASSVRTPPPSIPLQRKPAARAVRPDISRRSFLGIRRGHVALDSKPESIPGLRAALISPRARAQLVEPMQPPYAQARARQSPRSLVAAGCAASQPPRSAGEGALAFGCAVAPACAHPSPQPAAQQGLSPAQRAKQRARVRSSEAPVGVERLHTAAAEERASKPSGQGDQRAPALIAASAVGQQQQEQQAERRGRRCESAQTRPGRFAQIRHVQPSASACSTKLVGNARSKRIPQTKSVGISDQPTRMSASPGVAASTCTTSAGSGGTIPVAVLPVAFLASACVSAGKPSR